jgi:hypothetical protein
MKIAHINNRNELQGWYDEEIHTIIPTPNIEVTEEVWQYAINNSHNKVNEDGTTEVFDFRTEDEVIYQELYNKMREAKKYLEDTDFKMTLDYDKDVSEIKVKRAEAREFIRANQDIKYPKPEVQL